MSSADERDAVHMMHLLDEAGIRAQTRAGRGGQELRVLRAEAPHARQVLARARSLEREEDLLALLDEGRGVVPSRDTELRRRELLVARGLEGTLASLPGVRAARVHLATTPDDARGRTSCPGSASASVLLHHEVDARLPDAEQLRALVAGATPGLDPERVRLSLAEVPELQPLCAVLTRWGPLVVQEASVPALRALVAVPSLLFLLAGLWLWRVARPASEGDADAS